MNVPSGRGPVVREALLSAMPISIQQHPPAFTATRLLPGGFTIGLVLKRLFGPIVFDCTSHEQ